jgi:SAM-dependent methyltransferase
MYEADLAYIHDVGFGGFSRAAAPWILRQLHEAAMDRGRVVDLGCGPGVLTRALSSTGYEVTGIDVSPRMLEIARRIAPRATFRRFTTSACRRATPSFRSARRSRIRVLQRGGGRRSGLSSRASAGRCVSAGCSFSICSCQDRSH